MLKGRLFNVLGVFLWQTKAMCVMLVGVGVKLSMYDPFADSNAFFALQQVSERAVGRGSVERRKGCQHVGFRQACIQADDASAVCAPSPVYI